MTRRFFLWRILPIGIIVAVAGGFAWAFQDQIRGVRPAAAPVVGDIAELLDDEEPILPAAFSPITLPPGFRISIFAEDLGAPRVLALDPDGTLLASIPAQGKIVALDGEKIIVVTEGLRAPHGIAFGRCRGSVCDLYVAETDAVVRFQYDIATKAATDKTTLIDLPTGGRHTTRTFLYRDEKLLISIGSSCDVCVEKDGRRAAISELDLSTNVLEPFADGLRNAVFLALHPTTGAVWVTEMGRDRLGDDLPPDEINIVERGKDYGWPFCYGKNILDRTFDARASCDGRVPSHVDLQAHSAPLGLAFIPDSWPEEYRGDLLIAYHGSWNRTQPTGYMVVRAKLDRNGNAQGIEDFATGWLTPSGGTLGRPVGLAFDRDGNLFVSDDKAGVVYRISPPSP